MKELRAFVLSLEDVKIILKRFSAENKGDYAFTDYICSGGKVRVFTKDNQRPPGIYHIAKEGRKQYDSVQHAFADLGQPRFSFSRTGTEYVLGLAHVFLEFVEGEAMIEVEAENENQARVLAAQLGAITFIDKSLATYMEEKR